MSDQLYYSRSKWSKKQQSSLCQRYCCL